MVVPCYAISKILHAKSEYLNIKLSYSNVGAKIETRDIDALAEIRMWLTTVE